MESIKVSVRSMALFGLWILVIGAVFFFLGLYSAFSQPFTDLPKIKKKAPVVCPVPSLGEETAETRLKDIEKSLVGAGFDLLAGKYWRTYDLDGNLRADYQTEYDIRGVRPDHTIDMSTFPSVYYYDADGDGVYERVYLDMMGNGRCQDLRPYTGKEHSARSEQ